MSDWVRVFEAISEAGFTVSFAVDEDQLYTVTAVNERTGERFTVRKGSPYAGACEVAGRAGVRLDDVSEGTRPKFFD